MPGEEGQTVTRGGYTKINFKHTPDTSPLATITHRSCQVAQTKIYKIAIQRVTVFRTTTGPQPNTDRQEMRDVYQNDS